MVYGICWKSSSKLRLLSILVNTLIKSRLTLYTNFLPRSGNNNSQNNYNESTMANDSTNNYQNILLDNLDKPINITFSTPSPLNSLITKHKTNFNANGPHIKKYDQTALDYLKRAKF